MGLGLRFTYRCSIFAGSNCRTETPKFRVQGLGVEGLGFWVQGLGLRI